MPKNNKTRALYTSPLHKIGIYSHVHHIKLKFKLITAVYALRSTVHGFYVLGINLKIKTGNARQENNGFLQNFYHPQYYY